MINDTMIRYSQNHVSKISDKDMDTVTVSDSIRVHKKIYASRQKSVARELIPFESARVRPNSARIAQN